MHGHSGHRVTHEGIGLSKFRTRPSFRRIPRREPHENNENNVVQQSARVLPVPPGHSGKSTH